MNRKVLIGIGILVVIVIVAVGVLSIINAPAKHSVKSSTTSIQSNQSYTILQAPRIENFSFIASAPVSSSAPSSLDSGLVGGGAFTFSNAHISGEALFIRVLEYNGTFAASTYRSLTSSNSSEFGSGAKLTYLSNLPSGAIGIHVVAPTLNAYSMSILLNKSVVTIALTLPVNTTITNQTAVSTIIDALNATENVLK